MKFLSLHHDTEKGRMVSLKKGITLFIVLLMLITASGCSQPAKTPEQQLAEFIKGLGSIRYGNFEVSGTGLISNNGFTLNGVSNRNSADLMLEITAASGRKVKADYMADAMYLEIDNKIQSVEENPVNDILARFYGTDIDFRQLSATAASWQDIEVVSDEESTVYSFRIPSEAISEHLKGFLAVSEYLVEEYEYLPGESYGFEIKADKNGIIKQLSLSDGVISLNLNLERFGGTTVVKHDVLIPQKYKNLTYCCGHEYQPAEVKGTVAALTDNRTYLELILEPRANIDKMGWTGYLYDYGSRYYRGSNVVSHQIIVNEKNKVTGTYIDNSGHEVMFGLFDTKDGFYTLLCVARESEFENYRDRFSRYLENVRW